MLVLKRKHLNIRHFRKIVDDFTKSSALWASHSSRVVPEPASPSGFALQITCEANATGSCGAPDPRKGSCPPACILDETGWCQAVATTVANRRPSADLPLPTEPEGSEPFSCDEYETFSVWWRISNDYVAPPFGSSKCVTVSSLLLLISIFFSSCPCGCIL